MARPIPSQLLCGIAQPLSKEYHCLCPFAASLLRKLPLSQRKIYAALVGSAHLSEAHNKPLKSQKIVGNPCC